MIKKALKYVLLILLASIPLIIFMNKESIREYLDGRIWAKTRFALPCSSPIEYAIGEIDPRFGISREKLMEDAAQAEKIWEDPAGKNLFQYVPDSNFKINLVFDERQAKTNDAQALEGKLENLDSAHDSTVNNYNTLASEYDQKLKAYESEVAKYEKRLNKYNNDVKDWNENGGSESEFNQLKKEEKDLEKTREELEKQRKDLNVLASHVNQSAKNESEIVSVYNSEVKNYNERFGESKEFEKGVFDGTAINIYEFKENEDLVMTLIHEMGHALGIEHLNDPKSIMYYLMGEQDMENPRATDEDVSALKDLCRIK
jgi:predicted Zn-dependent protease